MIRSLNVPTSTTRRSSIQVPALDAQSISASSVAAKTASLVQSRASLMGHIGAFVFIAFGVSLASGLIGSVALESARRENLGFSSRAQAAATAVETLRLDVERLKLPNEVEGWAKLNGFSRVDYALNAATKKPAASLKGIGAATAAASSSESSVVPD